jgi:hypothetical protein
MTHRSKPVPPAVGAYASDIGRLVRASGTGDYRSYDWPYSQ